MEPKSQGRCRIPAHRRVRPTPFRNTEVRVIGLETRLGDLLVERRLITQARPGRGPGRPAGHPDLCAPGAAPHRPRAHHPQTAASPARVDQQAAQDRRDPDQGRRDQRDPAQSGARRAVGPRLAAGRNAGQARVSHGRPDAAGALPADERAVSRSRAGADRPRPGAPDQPHLRDQARRRAGVAGGADADRRDERPVGPRSGRGAGQIDGLRHPRGHVVTQVHTNRDHAAL